MLGDNIIASDFLPPVKPLKGDVCNGCGSCCREEVCSIGKLAFPHSLPPCPGLVSSAETQRFFCSLVATEIANEMPPVLQKMLGVGKGCDSDDI